MMRQLLPMRLRLVLRILINRIQTGIYGNKYNFAKKKNPESRYTEKIQLTQKLKPNDAKLINLTLASQSIEAVHIYPNQVFSFWISVGNPTKKNGYKESRSIVNNKIMKSVGGGLCQLSGMIYYMALIANLEIIERYSHSIDIYDDNTRYYPLGADATVVYGYKDLKIRNNYKQPINFKFVLGQETLTLELNCFAKSQKSDVKFEIVRQNDFEIEIATVVNGITKDKSIYRKPVPNKP